MLKTLEELQAWTATRLKRGRFVDGEDLKQLAQLIENIQHEVSADYVELPKDADGVPIRVGDVMEFSAFEIEKPATRMVDGIGQGVFFAWCGERGYQQHEAKRYRHHHEPTVEDVLREMCLEIDRRCERGSIDYDELFAEYAAKLRLAREGE